jgi:hypothetical protein
MFRRIFSRAILILLPLASLALSASALAAEWIACGTLNQLSSCKLADYLSTRYEYGIAYNSTEPMPAICTTWNRGDRIYNKLPYFVYSDNPTAGMFWGGFVFYTGTDAADDDTCGAGQWRHQYWKIESSGAVSAKDGNGCYGTNLTIYCRLR